MVDRSISDGVYEKGKRKRKKTYQGGIPNVASLAGDAAVRVVASASAVAVLDEPRHVGADCRGEEGEDESEGDGLHFELCWC